MVGKRLLWTSVVMILAIVEAVRSQEQYQHEFHAPMDEDSNYLLDWSFNTAEETMTFTVSVKTTGWIGFGISPYTGQMPGSDVIIAWVDNEGKAHLQDRFAESRSLPSLDSSQDYTLLSGHEKDGITTITFRRKFNTGDAKDLVLETGTTRLIWAYNRQDPASTTDIPIHQRMGTRSLNLFERMAEKDKPKLPSDTRTHDCRVPNVTLPPRKTSYWCVGLRLPRLTERHHIVKIAPVITNGNEGQVHHMILYECDTDDKWHEYSAECNSENMPNNLRYCRGGTIVAGWAVGGEPITFPAHAGLPIGGKGDPKFTVIEMHYDNPDLKSGIVDNSGFRFYYTKELRQHDIGVMTIGNLITTSMIIPERQTNWNITGYCPQFCTEKAVPKTGINIFGVFFHTHLAGIALSARHFRNGKELPLVAENKHYDFNYQEALYLKNDVTILPGDTLALTCRYGTIDRDRLTVGGYETTDEMCLNYLFYYPKAPLAACTTYTDYPALSPYLTKLMKLGKMPVPASNRSYDIMKSLQKTTIGDQSLINELKSIETYSTPKMLCTFMNNTLIGGFGRSVPNFVSIANYTIEGPNNAAKSFSTANVFVTLFYIVVMKILFG